VQRIEEQTFSLPHPRDEDFAGALVTDDEPASLPRVFAPGWAFTFGASEEIAPSVVPPPPPPPPPKPSGLVRQGGGRGSGAGFDPIYGLFPIYRAPVLAIVSGMLEVVTARGRTFAKLTADDGTVYIYAQVNVTHPVGRVEQGEIIGYSVVSRNVKPQKMLRGAPLPPPLPPTLEGAPPDADEPRQVGGAAYGVVPIFPPPRPPLPPRPPRPPSRPSQPNRAIASPPGFTTAEKIVLGIGAVAIVWALYMWITSPRTPKRKRQHRRRRRR
jgi:hypothetical protein